MKVFVSFPNWQNAIGFPNRLTELIMQVIKDNFDTGHVRVGDVEAGSWLRILLDLAQDHLQRHLVAALVPWKIGFAWSCLFFAILTYDSDDTFRQGVVLRLLWQLDEGATGLLQVLDVAAALADDHPRRRVRHDHLDDDGDGSDDDDDMATMMTMVC